MVLIKRYCGPNRESGGLEDHWPPLERGVVRVGWGQMNQKSPSEEAIKQKFILVHLPSILCLFYDG